MCLLPSKSNRQSRPVLSSLALALKPKHTTPGIGAPSDAVAANVRLPCRTPSIPTETPQINFVYYDPWIPNPFTRSLKDSSSSSPGYCPRSNRSSLPIYRPGTGCLRSHSMCRSWDSFRNLSRGYVSVRLVSSRYKKTNKLPLITAIRIG
jgi:hypothetical protein